MTNLLISINVDPSSKSCEGCEMEQYNDLKMHNGCLIFKERIPWGNRCNSCLSAQKQAEGVEK
jgi:hypothetical protein